MERDTQALADLVREENGKTYDEAHAEVDKTIELTEFACSLPQFIQSEFLGVSKGVAARAKRRPLSKERHKTLPGKARAMNGETVVPAATGV